MKSAVCLAGALLLASAGASLAQSPFDGTWKLDKTKLENTKPFSVYLAQGWYHCETCTPSFAVKADGTDQPVAGQNGDTLSVKEVDAKTIAFVGKKNQKVVYEDTVTVSVDGKTATQKGVYYTDNSDKPNHWISTAKRIGIAPSGVHAASGKWLEVSDTPEKLLFTTLKTTGDALTLTRPSGETYTAKFDGNDYPAKGGGDWYDAVSLKRIGERSFEGTEKLKGKDVESETWTVSNDGKTLTFVIVIKSSGQKTTYVATKVGEQLAKK